MRYLNYSIVVLFMLSVTLFSCESKNEEETRTITGTITDIGSNGLTSGLVGTLAIDDDDSYATDPPLKTWSLTWGTGNTLPYEVDISGIEDGEYYVYFTIMLGPDLLYGFYNILPNDAYTTKVKVRIEDGSVIDIEIDMT